MKLSYCKPYLNPRQMLWGLSSELSDLSTALNEICIVDTPLFRNPHYNAALVKISDAISDIRALRGSASTIPLGELADDINDISQLIAKL